MNLVDIEDLDKLFSIESIDVLLAELVWEHLTYEEGIETAKNCYNYLRPDGFIRCAVPNRYFRNEWYQNMVQVG